MFLKSIPTLVWAAAMSSTFCRIREPTGVIYGVGHIKCCPYIAYNVVFVKFP
jgi:hypothetical protein